MIEREVGQIWEWGGLAYPGVGWVLLAAAVVFGIAGVFSALEMRGGLRWWGLLLAALRTMAIAAFVFWILQPRWRIQGEREYPSKVVVMLDRSASMLLPAEGATSPSSGGGESTWSDSATSPVTRWAEACRVLVEGKLCQRLAENHEVCLYLFADDPPELIASWPRGSAGPGLSATSPKRPPPGDLRRSVAKDAAAVADTLPVGSASGSLAEVLEGVLPEGRSTRLGDALIHILQKHQNEPIAGIILLTDGVQNDGRPVADAVELAQRDRVPVFPIGFGPRAALPDVGLAGIEVPSEIRPKDPFPVVVVVEGQEWEGSCRVEVLVLPGRSGESPQVPAEVPAEGDQKPTPGADAGEAGRQARSSDALETSTAGKAGEALEPLPGKKGAAGEEPAVPRETSAREVAVARQETSVRISREVPAGTARFELAASEPGRYRLRVHLSPAGPDAHPENNTREMVVEVIDRPTRVLLLAGGPSRDYQFLRSLLYRDPGIRADIFLQTAQPGTVQEAEQLLPGFPKGLEELAEYDCVIAIDPDWRRLAGASEELSRALEALEEWVSVHGGGLILTAGSVHAGDGVAGWRSDPRCAAVLRLYPVVLSAGTGISRAEMYFSSEAWPLEWTAEAATASFLHLELGTEQATDWWKKFPGMYSCLQATEAKKGATVLAYFTDPRAAVFGRPPIYCAEQFYGAGRVFYLAGSETWRLRALGEGYFERFWTQVIRHVAQGRLSRQSPRLLLAVDREVYGWGDTVFVRAQLFDRQMRPAEREVLELKIIGPSGVPGSLRLAPLSGEKGAFRGSFVPNQVGEYQLVATLPDEPLEQVTRRIRVELPRREERDWLRNEKLLRLLAENTGGLYYPKANEAVEPDCQGYLPKAIRPRSRVEPFLGGTIEPTLRQVLVQLVTGRVGASVSRENRPTSGWMQILDIPLDWCLLVLAVAFFACEWILRRLWKLA
jgi:hypothetical protein